MLLCKMLLQREKEEEKEAGTEDQYERDLRNYNRSTGERWITMLVDAGSFFLIVSNKFKWRLSKSNLREEISFSKKPKSFKV